MGAKVFFGAAVTGALLATLPDPAQAQLVASLAREKRSSKEEPVGPLPYPLPPWSLSMPMHRVGILNVWHSHHRR